MEGTEGLEERHGIIWEGKGWNAFAFAPRTATVRQNSTRLLAYLTFVGSVDEKRVFEEKRDGDGRDEGIRTNSRKETRRRIKGMTYETMEDRRHEREGRREGDHVLVTARQNDDHKTPNHQIGTRELKSVLSLPPCPITPYTFKAAP